MSVQIELESIEGLSILRDRAQEKIDQNDLVPVCLSPASFVRLMDWVLGQLALVPPKHHVPTVPVSSERQSAAGRKPSTMPVEGPTESKAGPIGVSGGNRAKRVRKRQNKRRESPNA